MKDQNDLSVLENDERNSSEEDSALTRRRFIKGSAVAGSAVAATGVLAACGSSSSNSSGSKSGVSPSAPKGGKTSPTGKQLQTILGEPKNIIAKGPGTLKVAAQLALTGAGSVYGTTQSAGWAYGVQQVADWTNGKLVLDTKYYDNQSGVPQAEAAAGREAGLSGVPVLLSSYIFGFGAILPFSKQYKMFTPDPGGGAGPIPGPFEGKPYCYGFRSGYPTDCFDGIVKYFKEKLPSKKRWVLEQPVIAPPYNDAVTAYTKKLFAQYGMDYAGLIMAPLGATDYTSTIQKIKALNPDVVLYSSFGTDIAYMAKEAISAGATWLSAGIDFQNVLAKLAGPALKDWYLGFDFLNVDQPGNDWAKYFVKEWTSAHKGVAPDYYNAGDYCTAFAVASLVDRILGAGGDVNSGDDYVKQLEANPTFPHVYGGPGKTGKIVIDTTTHSPSAIEMQLFQPPANGQVTPVKALANYNIKAADFQLL
jgi:ABC-type branched-subunit amino acid transport system substrate-binding protein